MRVFPILIMGLVIILIGGIVFMREKYPKLEEKQSKNTPILLSANSNITISNIHFYKLKGISLEAFLDFVGIEITPKSEASRK